MDHAQDGTYAESIVMPLSLGHGIAAFMAHVPGDEGNVWVVTAQYDAGRTDAYSEDPNVRAHEAIARQHSAREIVAEQGMKAVVT